MIITKAEFEINPSRYLDLVGEEEILITNEGECIAKLVGTKASVVDSLVGLLPSSVTDKEVREERIRKHEKSTESNNDIRDNPAFGLWRDRDDLTDPVAAVRSLR